MSKEEILATLQNVGMDPKDVPHHLSLKRASVLVPLFFRSSNDNDSSSNDKQEPYILLTQRNKKMKSHPGQVCFPGGKQDEADIDDVMTALRETNEEVGIPEKEIKVICRLRTVESVNHLCVTPIVGYIENDDIIDTLHEVVSQDEVEAVFYCPLAIFLEEPQEQYTVEWSKEIFVYRSYPYVFEKKEEKEKGSTTTNNTSSTTFMITGLTAHIAHQVAEMVLPAPDSKPSKATAETKRPPARLVTQSSDDNDNQLQQNQPHQQQLSGYLWKREQSSTGRSYWSRRYFVCDTSSDPAAAASTCKKKVLLNQYDSDQQAARKAASANKKHRLFLDQEDASRKVTIIETGDPDKKEFLISILDGRIEWYLAASTSEDRNQWVRFLEAAK